MTVKEIISDGLKALEFGGLCNPDGECGCDADNLAPCGDSYDVLNCQPAYEVVGRCKTCAHHCDGYDPDGPGVYYTIKKPEEVSQ